MRLRTLPAIAIACSLIACELEPDVGEPIAERCSDDDADPANSVSFSRDILPLLVRPQAGCTPCHDPRTDGAIGFETAGLEVTSRDTLLRGGFNSQTTIVVPGRPCDSVLYQKLSPGPPFGSRMPLSGPPFFSGLELRLVHDWIAEGAKDN